MLRDSYGKICIFKIDSVLERVHSIQGCILLTVIDKNCNTVFTNEKVSIKTIKDKYTDGYGMIDLGIDSNMNLVTMTICKVK